MTQEYPMVGLSSEKKGLKQENTPNFPHMHPTIGTSKTSPESKRSNNVEKERRPKVTGIILRGKIQVDVFYGDPVLIACLRPEDKSHAKIQKTATL